MLIHSDEVVFVFWFFRFYIIHSDSSSPSLGSLKTKASHHWKDCIPRVVQNLKYLMELCTCNIGYDITTVNRNNHCYKAHVFHFTTMITGP